MRLLIIIDYPGWAFDHIAHAIGRFNTDLSISIDIQHIRDTEWMRAAWHRYDVIYLMGWFFYDSVPFIPLEKMMAGVHSSSLYREIDINSPKAIKQLNQFIKLNTVAKRLHNTLAMNVDTSKITYTPNGVDTSLFRPSEFPSEFTICTVSSQSRWIPKGVNKYTIPASQKTNSKFIIASDYGIKRKNPQIQKISKALPHNQMPDLYNQSSCYVCASLTEGFSLSMLEAGACGRPIITTDVSGTEELIIDGETGFIVERDVDAISEKINLLKNDKTLCRKMGANIRQRIKENFSWRAIVPLWLNFFKGEK